MQAFKPENLDDAKFNALCAGTEFEPDPGLTPDQDSEPDLESGDVDGIYSTTTQFLQNDTCVRTQMHLVLPVGTSIIGHICLLILMHAWVEDDKTARSQLDVRPPGIQITFRPRPAPRPLPEVAERDDVAETEPAANESLAVRKQPAVVADEPPPTSDADQLAEQSRAEPLTQALRLAAPTMPDIRNLIQNRAQNDATARIYNNIDCDERQRRTDLIDCGDDDPSAQYNFAAAEQNTSVEFFAELTLPVEDTGTPADRTTGDARTRASLNNMNGNLGANPLIRSVLGQP